MRVVPEAVRHVAPSRTATMFTSMRLCGLAGMERSGSNAGAGTICGLANLYPQVLRRLHDAASDTERAPELEHIERLLKLLEPYSLMPALKAALAEIVGDPGWLAVREPLVTLGEDARNALRSSLTRSGLARSPQ